MNKLRPTTYQELVDNFSVSLPENFNFAFDVLEKKAKETPDALCVRHVDNDLNMRDFTFAEIDEAASRVASSLEKRGVKKGDRVMLMLYRRIEWWKVLLGLNKLGAVAIPAPGQLTVKDVEFRCNKAKVKVLFVDSTVAHIVDEAKTNCTGLELSVQVGDSENTLDGWVDYETIESEGATYFPRPTDPAKLACDKDPMLIFFSSGTTGMPKMVLHSHRYPMGHMFTGMYWHDLEPGDIHLSVADTGWAKAVWGKSYGQWMAGAAVFVYDFRGKFNPSELLHVVAFFGVTTFCAPPTVYRFLVREDLSKFDLSCLRHCTTAGELLNDSVFHAWKKATGLSLYEGFGQTETALQIATLPFMEPKPGSIGKPVPGWKVTLLDEDGEEVAFGEEGEICVKADEDTAPCGLFLSYLDEPALTAKTWHDGWFHTGDKAWKDEDGYFWFLGRVDDLIKTSGYKVGPFEVESALVAHPAVIEAAVTGVPDAVRGQVIKATVVLAEGYQQGEEMTELLQEFVRSETAPYKYPRIIEYVVELPKTISGKIKRAEIRQKDEAGSKLELEQDGLKAQPA